MAKPQDRLPEFICVECWRIPADDEDAADEWRVFFVGNRLARVLPGVRCGRPKGLARATRELVGDNGMALVELWWSIAQDETRRDRDRLEASRLLADRGWGKAANFEPLDGDPLDLGDVEAAAEELRAAILRLAPDPEAS
jgi:hypothetical protein